MEHILDADSYHINEDGEYDFDPDLATEAHTACFRKYLQLLPDADEVDSIAVCNTHTVRAEYTPYVQAARAFALGDRIRLIHCKCSVETAIERNIHEVPPQVIGRMAERWEEPGSYDPPQHVVQTDSLWFSGNSFGWWEVWMAAANPSAFTRAHTF